MGFMKRGFRKDSLDNKKAKLKGHKVEFFEMIHEIKTVSERIKEDHPEIKVFEEDFVKDMLSEYTDMPMDRIAMSIMMINLNLEVGHEA